MSLYGFICNRKRLRRSKQLHRTHGIIKRMNGDAKKYIPGSGAQMRDMPGIENRPPRGSIRTPDAVIDQAVLRK